MSTVHPPLRIRQRLGRVHGTDIDAEIIGGCGRTFPWAYQVAPHTPRSHIPDHHFDLVINHSVFTHLDEHHQNLWLAELQRIAEPGALLLLTIKGQSSWNRTYEASVRVGEDPERWRADLRRAGMVFIGDDHFVGSTHPDFYHSRCMPRGTCSSTGRRSSTLPAICPTDRSSRIWSSCAGAKMARCNRARSATAACFCGARARASRSGR